MVSKIVLRFLIAFTLFCTVTNVISTFPAWSRDSAYHFGNLGIASLCLTAACALILYESRLKP